jgi:Fe-S cluster assembly protein SufD
MSITAHNEAFLAKSPPQAEALPWLADAAALKTDDAPTLNTDGVPPWIKALRDTGAECFAANGLPHPKDEGWQYTNLRGLKPGAYHYAQKPAAVAADKLPARLPGCSRLVVVNGQYQPQLSDTSPEISVLSLMEAAARKTPHLEEALARVGDLAAAPFTALNSAYLRDGFVLSVAPGKEPAAPIEVVFYNSGDGLAIYPRLLYRLGENSGLTVIERHLGEGVYFTNAYGVIQQDSASRLRFYRLVEESGKSHHISRLSAQMQKSASFEGFSMGVGGGVTRQEFELQLLDTGICSNIGGTYLLKGQESHDFSILADHFEPGGASAQHFRGVLDDQARAVFQGKIHVRRAAQKTDGYQSHHALLLAPTAEASAKPELEIYADDVKCGHGATSGPLDPVALFYLQSRGIEAAEAAALLAEAFLAEDIDKITSVEAREMFHARAARWLSERKT